MTEIKHTVLEIPTARRQANQLFTQHSWGVQLGVTENKSNEWQGRGIEPRMTRLLVQHPNHSATQPPGSLFEFTWQFLEKNVLVYLQALHHQLKTSFLNKQRTSARCLICKCQKELFFLSGQLMERALLLVCWTRERVIVLYSRERHWTLIS